MIAILKHVHSFTLGSRGVIESIQALDINTYCDLVQLEVVEEQVSSTPFCVMLKSINIILKVLQAAEVTEY